WKTLGSRLDRMERSPYGTCRARRSTTEREGDSRMRIHSVEAIAVDIPLARNFGGSTYSVLKRSTVITRMRTEDGLTSEVYNGDNREDGPEIARLIREELAPAAKGISIFDGERVWAQLFALSHPSRRRKILLEAIACVDCGLWDLVGKAL